MTSSCPRRIAGRRALAVLLLVCGAVAGCSSSGDEVVAKPSASSAIDDGVPFCELLDEADRHDLAGAELEFPTGPVDPLYTEGGCAWRDAGVTEWTVELHMTGMRANAWAKDLSALLAYTLSGPELQKDYEGLVDAEDDLALLDDEEACDLWVEVSTEFATAPRDTVMLDVFTNSSEGEPFHVVRAEICRDGVFAELAIVSDDPISKERAEPARTRVETVWDRARKQLPDSPESGAAA